MAGPASPEEFAALHTLADVVEPVKDYTRGDTATAVPTSLSPLNRLVDAIPPESHPARHFSELVNKYLASSCNDKDSETRLRAQLTAWRDNDAKLQTLEQRSSFVKEVAATSQDLSTIGAIGLAALDAVHTGTRQDDTWKTQQLSILTQAQKPKTQLLLMPVAVVQKLVEAAAAGGACSNAK
jgi:hexosaminidase